MKQRPSASINGEWLDHHPWIPVLFLVLLPILVEIPLFSLGVTTDPLELGGGVVHPSSTGLSFIGVTPRATTIDNNIGRQLQALGHLSASEWLHGRVPWWNHYSGIGLPLAGEMQPASFFLPFILLLLLKNGILWLTIAMQMLSGLATFALLRTLGLGRLAACTGGALYSLNGTFAWLSGMQGNTIPFLPLLIYGVELACRDGIKGKGAFWIAVSLFGSLAAGFPETAYINGLFALTWALYRFSTSISRAAFVKTVVHGGSLGLLLSSPLLIAFFDYITATDIVAAHRTDNIVLHRQVLSNIFLPYVFGGIYYAPAGNWNIWTTWGMNGGYESIIIVLVALLGLQGKRERGLRWAVFLWIIICLAASFGIPPFHSIVQKLPFMRDVNVPRYSSPTWELAFTVLAAMALDDLKCASVSIRWPLIIVTVMIAACGVFAWPEGRFWGWQPHEADTMKCLLYGVLAIVLVSLAVMVGMLRFGKGEARRYGISLVLIVTAAWMFMVPESAALKHEPDSLPGVSFLQRNLGLSRFFTLGPIEPNYSAYFQISSINYAYCPVASNWAAYVERNLFPDVANTVCQVLVCGVTLFSYSANDGQVALSTFGRNYKEAAVRYVVAPPGEGILASISVAEKDSCPSELVLLPGQTVSSSFTLPLGEENAYPVSMIGVVQAPSARPEVMTGGIQIVACGSENQCATGEVALSFSHPGRPVWVPLDEPLNARPGEQLTISVTYLSGTTNLVIAMASGASWDASSMTPLGRVKVETMRLELAYGDGMAGVKAVYSDSVMDIWELPGASPYYSVMNGSCALSNEGLDSVDAECTSRATLLRRELYMDGWSARINQSPVNVEPVDNLFQGVELQAGRNAVVFRFAPPYVQYAWLLFWLGFLGLIGEMRKYLEGPRA